MKDWLSNHLPESVVALFVTFIGWLAQRAISKVDRQEERLQALERDKVTRADIEDLRESIDATITRSLARVESRTDEIMMYLIRDEDR